MRRILLVGPIFGLAILLVGAAASAERLSDRDVRELMGRVASAADRVAGSIDRQYHGAVIRSPAGETDLDSFVQDLRRSCREMRSRFQGSYSASAEVKDCLERIGVVEQRVQREANLFGAEQAYDGQLRPVAARLAAAYGVDLAEPSADWTVRRYNDRELEDKANDLLRRAQAFEKEARKASKGLDRDQRSALTDAAGELARSTKELRGAVRSDRGVEGLLGTVEDAADEIDERLEASGVEGLDSSWASLVRLIEDLDGAYGRN